MITYKGSKLVIGKRFIIEGELGMYQGKVFGNMHRFITKDSQEIILTEQEANQLEQFRLNEHSLLSEQDNAEDLRQIIISYTDKQLNICKDKPTNVYHLLLSSFKEEIDKLQEQGMTYQVSYRELSSNNLLDQIESFLKDTQHNISDTSMPNIYVTLNNYIYTLEKKVGE